MSEMREVMLRTLDRIVDDTVTSKMREVADLKGNQAEKEVAASQAVVEPLWTALQEAGITSLGASGGEADVSFGDAMELVRRAGFHALPVPMGDLITARRVLSIHGLADSEGLTVLVAPGGAKDVVLRGGNLTGRAIGVPWGRDATQLILAVGNPEGASSLVLVNCQGAEVQQGANMAGEPRDDIDLGAAKVVLAKPVPDAVRIVEAEGALLRSVQMSGALGAVLAHCMTWVGDRVQFGKPISKHQAIQHLMAQLAEEVAAASAAVDLAVQASEVGPDRLACAIAKARVGEAAGKAANIAHAVFGAMGFTREHQLHYSTRRLWAWRNEFGGETYWQGEIGRAVARQGGRRLWETLTATG